MRKNKSRVWCWAALVWWAGATALFGANEPAAPALSPALGDKLFAALAPGDPACSALAASWTRAESANAPSVAASPESCVRDLLRNFQDNLNRYPPGFLTPLPDWNDDTRRAADAALAGTFTLQGVTGTVPHRADGGWDWTWRGPNDDPEFAWFLNRLPQIPALFVAWRETHDDRYRRALNAQLRDWLRQNPRPGGYSFSSSWRTLEVARRAEESWMPVLFAREANSALDGDVLLALLADVPDHAAALRADHSFWGNHLITEMTGLAAIALAFPQFKDSPDWLDYALTEIHGELNRQFYPDGAQTELANLYQRVVLLELQHLVVMLAAAGRDQESAALRPDVERGWNYYAGTLGPLGHGPLNNDSSVEDDAGLVREMAGFYHRDDWLYLASAGQAGRSPDGPPTNYFPYAGLAVLRGGYGTDAPWAFFSLGPRGVDHQHAERLQLSLGGDGHEFLVDDGRDNYQPGPWRDYFTGPQGHNVILLDGRGSIPPPDHVDTPPRVRAQINVRADFFEATAPFAGDALLGEGPAYHTRAVLYPRQNYWIVADRVLCAGGPHQLETLWHFHPDCTVRRAGNLLYTDDAGRPNLGLLAVAPSSTDWSVDLVKGRGLPVPQGWYSPEFNTRLPATCAVFTTNVSAPATFLWIIWIVPPGQDVPATQPRVTLDDAESWSDPAGLSLRIDWPKNPSDHAHVPFRADAAFAWSRAADLARP